MGISYDLDHSGRFLLVHDVDLVVFKFSLQDYAKKLRLLHTALVTSRTQQPRKEGKGAIAEVKVMLEFIN
eukprot:g40505.t1